MKPTTPKRFLTGLAAGLLSLATVLPGVAAPAPKPLPTGQAALSCGAELACTVGERRTYDYSAIFVADADVETVSESGYNSATLMGNSQVSMTVVESKNERCTYEVVLQEVEVHEIVRGEAVQSARGDEVAALVRDPFYFTQQSDGQILDVTVGREDTPETVTFKRGIVNAMNVTLRDGEAYQVVESDIAGTHLSDYRVRRTESRTELDRQRSKADAPLLKGGEIAINFDTEQSSSVIIDHGSCIISQVNIDETVIIDAPDASDPPVSEYYHHETVTVRAAANMTITSQGIVKANKAPTAADFKRRGMVTLPVSAAVALSPDALDNGPVIARLLGQLEEDVNNKQFVRELSRAVRADAKGVSHLERYIASKAPTGKLGRILGSLLISVGTEEAQNVLIDQFLSRSQGEDRGRLIGLSTLIGTPTERLVGTVSAIANDGSSDDWPAATLALGAYADSLRATAPGLAAKLDQHLLRELRAAGADDTVLYLRALGNAGAADAMSEIAGFLGSADSVTRLSAAIAMRKIDSEDVDNRLLEHFISEPSRSVRQVIQTVVEERIEKGLGEQTRALKDVICDWSWSETFGGNIASATFSASKLVEDEPYLVDIQAAAEGQVFGNTFNILDLQLLTEEVNAQDRRFRFFISLAGNDIVNIDDTETCSIAATDTLWDESIDLLNLASPPIPIIGPLTLSFNLDLAIEFYVNFFRDGDWCTANSELQMGFTPGVALDADGYATLSLLIVRGGVGVAGTLVGIEFPIYAQADMVFQDAAEVCFVIDAQLLVADMELYAWGQYWTFWSGWNPDPRPRWTLWSFNLNPEAWNLVTLCDANPDLNCLQDVLWWDGSTIDAWYDGANCFVTTPPAGGDPFIANNAYYLEVESSCPAGMPWDGTGCLDANLNIFPGVSAYTGTNGSYATLTFYKFGTFGPIPMCPSGWTQTSFIPNVSRNCQRLPPTGYSPSDFFIVSQTSFLSKLYIDGSGSCSAGNLDSTGCWLGNAPGGTNAFLWSGNFYYAE